MLHLPSEPETPFGAEVPTFKTWFECDDKKIIVSVTRPLDSVHFLVRKRSEIMVYFSDEIMCHHLIFKNDLEAAGAHRILLKNLKAKWPIDVSAAQGCCESGAIEAASVITFNPNHGSICAGGLSGEVRVVLEAIGQRENKMPLWFLPKAFWERFVGRSMKEFPKLF